MRKVPYPPGAPLNEGGFPAFDSNGRPTPWTPLRAARLESSRRLKDARERVAIAAQLAEQAARRISKARVEP